MRRIWFRLSVAVLVWGSAVTAADEEPHAGRNPEERRDNAEKVIAENLLIGGLIEAELYGGKEAGESVSGMKLATFELGLEMKGESRFSGRTLLLWEEDDTEPIEVDEALVTVELYDGLSLSAGRMYVPFGKFDSHFVSDPLVLELAETRKTAFMADWCRSGACLKAAVFDRQSDESEEIDGVVLSLEYASSDERFSVGCSWISSIAESDLLISENEGREEALEEVQGAGCYVFARRGRWIINGELIGALESFKDEEGTGLERVYAWNVEGAVCFLDDVLELAVKAEGSRGNSYLAERQAGVCLSCAIRDGVNVALEYLHGKLSDDEDRDMATFQVSYEF